jgi:hypothetical protein
MAGWREIDELQDGELPEFRVLDSLVSKFDNLGS